MYAYFLALSKAFDRVNYDLLWQKLNKMGMLVERVAILGIGTAIKYQVK